MSESENKPVAFLFGLPEGFQERLAKLGISSEDGIKSFVWLSLSMHLGQMEASAAEVKKPKKSKKGKK